MRINTKTMAIGMLVLFGGTFLLKFFLKDPATTTKGNNTVKDETPIADISYVLSAMHPHDTTAFTEGLFFKEGQLFESTGATPELASTRSLFGIVDLKTGKINKKAELDKTTFFGEGIVALDDKIYQVTYKNQKGFIYDAKTYKRIGEFSYPNAEGWGLTTDGQYVIMSDGTNFLTYFDPKNNMSVAKKLAISYKGFTQNKINELEYIDGFIFANVWQTTTVVKIDPATGKIVGKLELAGVFEDAQSKYNKIDVLNGIAYNPATKRMFVTGKMFPQIYELELR
jgi:glutaminyl-peptide cyclotransferase